MTYPDDFINKVIQGDCLEVMKQLPDKCIDLVLTDPPYGVDYGGGQNEIQREKLANDAEATVYKDLFPEIYRVLKNEGSAYVFYANGKENDVFPYICFDKYQVLIWNKVNTGYGAMNARYHHRYEPFLYLTKKSPTKWNGGTTERDLWDITKRESNDFHPTQKPTNLIARMISNSSDEGDIVLDPFLGSGTTALVCKQLGRKYIGIEISKKYCEIANNRLIQDILL